MGVALKPAAGVLDLAAKSAEMVRTPRVAGPGTYGCRPRHIRLQAPPHTVAGPATYGCRPLHIRLQVGQSVAQSAAAAAHGSSGHGGTHAPL